MRPTAGVERLEKKKISYAAGLQTLGGPGRSIYLYLGYLTLRRLMSYIYIYMEHPFLMFLDHTQRRSTVGRTPLYE